MKGGAVFPHSAHLVETLARLENYAEAHPAGTEQQTVAIAISRQAGSRAPDVAQAVGKRLGWLVYDNELLKQIAAKRGLQERLLERLDEHAANWVEQMAASFSQAGSLDAVYLKQLVELLVALSKAGQCVIVGRGAAQALPPETTLRVRLVAPRDWRVAVTEKRLGLAHGEAAHWVDRTDAERDRFVKSSFHKDPNDPLGYDLILNTSRFGPDECAEVIAEAARLLEARVTAQQPVMHLP
jgi:cytidylate kinase